MAEPMTVTGPVLASLILTFSLVTYGFLRVGEMLVRDISRRGKARILWLDPDGGPLRISFHPIVNGNEIVVGERRYILSGDARIGGLPATWILHPRHGWSFVGPKDSETVNSDALLMRLAIANPAAYHLAVARNRARDALAANADDDRWGWVKPVAMVGMVAILCIFAVVGFVAYRVTVLAAQQGG